MERLLATDPKPLAPIPVIGFAVLSKFGLAEQLIRSIDYPVQHLVVINNSGTKTWQPMKPKWVENLWHVEVPCGLGANGAWNLVIKSTPYAPYWVLPNDDCEFVPGALAAIAKHADPAALNFVQINEPWSCPVIGERVVLEAGLWDEAYYPIYFDDNDYERRIRAAQIPIKQIPAQVAHAGSATLHSGFQTPNTTTYARNQNLFQHKIATNDYSAYGWQLAIRRANRWD